MEYRVTYHYMYTVTGWQWVPVGEYVPVHPVLPAAVLRALAFRPVAYYA